MSINAINPSFNGEMTNKVCRTVKKTIADPTDVNNKDAAIGGTVAAAGGSAAAVGGAKYGSKGVAVVANRLASMKKFARHSQTLVQRAQANNKYNVKLLHKMASSVLTFFENSKSMQWLAKAMKSNIAKKVGGAAGGVLALGITGAQLWSAGDMAVEAINTYKD